MTPPLGALAPPVLAASDVDQASAAEAVLGALFTLFVLFVAAKLGEEIARRLGQPGVVGELAGGFVVGPHALGWAIGGLVLALAGAFQFTSLKEACLRQCRQPGGFLLRYYERGTGGGFRLGARHGLFCVGCCWALMLVMFAVGIANLVWMAALTALMLHEKTRPLGARAVPITGIVLLGGASVTLLYSAYKAGALG